MTVIPIARYFTQSGMDGGSGGKGAPGDGAWSALEAPANSEEDIAHRIEAAAANGRDEGRAAAAAEFEARLAQERGAFAERVRAERDGWLAAEGARLSGAIGPALRQLEAAIADGVAHVLRPFMISALREQALAALKETVATLLSSRPAMVRIAGPQPLLDALNEGLGADGAAVDYVAEAGVDVRVVADHTVIETHMQAWIDRFDQATGQAAR